MAKIGINITELDISDDEYQDNLKEVSEIVSLLDENRTDLIT